MSAEVGCREEEHGEEETVACWFIVERLPDAICACTWDFSFVIVRVEKVFSYNEKDLERRGRQRENGGMVKGLKRYWGDWGVALWVCCGKEGLGVEIVDEGECCLHPRFS